MLQSGRLPRNDRVLSDKCRKWVARYVAGQLNRDQRAAVRRYLRGSPAARAYCSRLLKAHRGGPRQIVVARGSLSRRKTPRKWILLAIGAIAGLLIFAGLYGASGQGPGQSTSQPVVIPETMSEQVLTPGAGQPSSPSHAQPARGRAEQESRSIRSSSSEERAALPSTALAKPPAQHSEFESTPSPAHPQQAVPVTVTFTKDVRPILEAKCAACHGKDKKSGGLDVQTVASLRKGGDGGPSLVPGMPEKSLLWDDIGGGRMPPKGKPGLTAAEKKVIQAWIARGALEK
jgi:Planctomycete cytochrome C